MRVRSKLTAIVVFISVVPLLVSALTALRLHHQAIQTNLAEFHRGAADNTASRAEDFLSGVDKRLDLLAHRTIQWPALTDAERQGALWLVYRQFEDAAVVSLLDDTGKGIGAAAYVHDDAVKELRGHPRASDALLRAFAESIPFDGAKKQGIAWGKPFRVQEEATPFLPVAITVPGRGQEEWVVAMAMSMNSLCEKLAPRGTSPAIVVAASGGAVLCSSTANDSPELVEFALASGRRSGPMLERRSDGTHNENLVSVAELKTGWVVAAWQPVDQAFVTSRKLQIQSAIWFAIALAAAIASGLVLSGSIIDPVQRLVEGAKRLSEGHLDHRLNLQRDDEFGELGKTFDQMGEGLEARDAEIRRWNEELQKRVDERTTELARAQQQLLASHKMSAVSTLAAGAAHEINNPLTSVLGVLQLQLAKAAKSPDRAKEAVLLQSAEKEAKRIKEIVERMVELGQAEDLSFFKPIDLREVARSAIDAMRPQFDEKELRVNLNFTETKPVRASFSQIQHALVQVLRNAVAASSRGGAVEVKLTMLEGEIVTLSVIDEGVGIPADNLGKVFEPFFTTKRDWQSRGLGLAVAYRILQNQGGTIRAESTEGQGTTIVMTLPVGRKLAHLE